MSCDDDDGKTIELRPVRYPDTFGTIGLRVWDKRTKAYIDWSGETASIRWYPEAGGDVIEVQATDGDGETPAWRHVWGDDGLPEPNERTTYLGIWKVTHGAQVYTSTKRLRFTALPADPRED
jgi:hypothetical protein